MLNYIWGGMIIISVMFSFITGRTGTVGNAAIESSKEAVELCITMLGVMSLWMGLMEMAKNNGVLKKMERLLLPFIGWMFPEIPKTHPARQYMVTNIVANILGLGWAATPAGLQAMEKLAKYPVHKNWEKHVATDEMCTFLVLNISSLQLIPVTIVAYRNQFGAENPSAIVVPAILATFASTMTGILYCKWKCRKRFH
ncbi:MAG: nucleoside recognition protein [Eubacterium sp.]|nr:nucleoside recognition protein [Eubacterium sp.]